jgi:hypothetical protein
VSTDRTQLGIDPSACYRHPDRTSWTLCDRCGRTICPECQILSPGGVNCAVCVAETGGSVQWQPAASRPAPKRRPAVLKGAGARRRALPLSSGGRPTAAWTVLAVAAALWVVGFVTGDLPVRLLAAYQPYGWQLWRFLTAPLVSPSGVNGIVGFALTALFWGLTAPQAERIIGLRRFLAVLGVSTVLSTAAALLSGQAAYGLSGPLFGVFAATLVIVWGDVPTRTRFLVMIGVNLLLILLLGGSGLATVVGGLIGGAGTLALLRRNDDRPLPKPWTPQTILIGGSALLAVLAALAAS